MSTEEIKSEIQKVLDRVPEESLKDILDYLKELQGTSEERIKTAKNVRKILREDHELLKRLAQ